MAARPQVLVEPGPHRGRQRPLQEVGDQLDHLLAPQRAAAGHQTGWGVALATGTEKARHHTRTVNGPDETSTSAGIS